MKLKHLFLTLFALAVSASALIAMPQQAKAVSPADWRAGRIIDDAVFFNKDSMSVQQIQDFLNAKVPNCDRWNPTRFTYAGKPYGPPYTCLKEYQENPTTHENNIARFNPDGSPYSVPGGWSAAQIIKDASMAYGINPQVLIVMLQKETAIVTDTWAAGWQYDRAMGYGCPDNGPNNTANCNASYYGFYNQVGNAAWQLKRYTTNPNEYNFKAGVTRNILWQVGGVCGSSPVYLENAATAALYNYTPYQPNQAALNNLYGTGDGCSAYGNRNFWRLFNDWFGNGLVAEYDYTFVGSTSAHNKLDFGQKITSEIAIRNTGRNTWYADGATPPGARPTRLSMGYYRDTAFASTTDPNWLGTKNQIKMTPTIVNPGEIATFTFELVGPNYRIDDYPNFIPVVDGIGFMKNVGMTFSLSSDKPKYQFIAAVNQPTVINPGQNVTSSIIIKNTGNAPWYSDDFLPAGKRPIRLASQNYKDVPFASPSDPRWLGTKNQIKMSPAVVNPGENATFSFELIGPSSGGSYLFKFLPVLDGVEFLTDYSMQYVLYTPIQTYKYSFASAVDPPTAMNPGEIATVNIKIKNTGTATWKNETTKSAGNPAIRLIMSQPWYRNSNFADLSNPSWITNGQIKLLNNEVRPGEIGEFSFTWKAPAAPGTYFEHFAPVADGVTLMDDIGMVFRVTVR
jgi:hypothetical protein